MMPRMISSPLKTPAALLAAFLCLTAGASTAQTLSVNGLIVKLRDAPSHEQVDRERTLAGGMSATGEARRERLQRVMREAAVDLPSTDVPSVPDLLPVGRAAQLLRYGRSLSAAEAATLAERLRERPDVEWVVPNEREQLLQVPQDPRFSEQWWLQTVRGSNGNAIDDRLRGVPGFQSAWARSTGGPAAVVAVLDTGITDHPELAGRVLPGYDFVSVVEYANDGDGRDDNPSDPGDWVTESEVNGGGLFQGCFAANSSWHGTIISGQIAALTNNGAGVAAMNWDGHVVPVRVAGKCGAEVADIVDGIRWAAGLQVTGAPRNENPAKVINISFGGASQCNEAYQSAIDEARLAGAVVVAAAGNDSAAPTRPANCNGVVAVGSLNRDGFKTSYSSFGPQLTVSTVGGDDERGAWGTLLADTGLLGIGNPGATSPAAVTAGSPDGFVRAYGTSFSAPLVSGAVSLMLSVNPELTPDQIIAGLRASARPHVTSSRIGACSDANPGRCICTTATCGAGMLDADQALVYAAAPASYVAPNRQGANIDAAEVNQAVGLGADRAPNPTPPPPGGGSSDDDDDDRGGGAMGTAWLLGLALAAWALGRVPAARRRA
jgi:serine protease